MPVPVTTEQLTELVKKSNLVEEARLGAYLEKLHGQTLSANEMAQQMIEEGLLTNFQKEQLLQGKWRGYTIGKFKVLERLGTGGMGSVYLCEHQKMKHKVAVKVLPTAKASDPAALGRFYREARAAGILDHPNIVRAHDIDQEGELHYLVMDYVEGVNLQHLVARSTGPMPYARACHYIYQAALGLEHAYAQGLIHRDIKPANLLLDRTGTVKILDMGLARFYEDNKDLLTIKFDDNNVLGTADYVSPEQATDSHEVDIRTDIYSLGATFYFLLTGGPLFPEGKIAQKLIWHQTREPAPIRQRRRDIPPELEVIVEKMLAKEREARFQTPAEVVAALEPWVQTPVEPPAEAEIPQMSLAARNGGGSDGPAGRTPQRNQVGAASQRHAQPPRSTRPAPVASTAVATAGPSTDQTTPNNHAPDVPTDRLDPPPAPSPAVSRSFRPPVRLLRHAAMLLVTLFVGTALGYGLRMTVLAPSSDDGQKCHIPRVLVVERSRHEGVFPTIVEALKEAQPGDTIEVREETWEEILRLDSGGTVGNGVMLRGAGPGGKPVLWRAPAAVKEAVSLIHLAAVQSFKLSNFTLDGQDAIHHLVTISGPCPGLVVEQLKLTAFRSSGVRLTSGAGEESAPILLRKLHAAPTRDADAGIVLDGYSDQPCRHIKVSECRFEARCQTGIVVAGPVVGLEVTRSHFSGLLDGIVYRKGASPSPLQLSLTWCEFGDIHEAGLRFEAPPPVEGSVIELKDNRFQRVKTLALMDGFRSEPLRVSAAWIWGGSDSSANLFLRKRFTLETAPTRAVLSLTADPSCVVWVNGKQVGKAVYHELNRQVQAFDVARHLLQGENVLAVEAKSGPRAGVLAELYDNATGVYTRTLASDGSWKSASAAPSGWRGLKHDDKDWASASVVAPYGQGQPTWKIRSWDAVVQEQFKYQAHRVFPPPTGNERDATSAEGFPLFDAAIRGR